MYFHNPRFSGQGLGVGNQVSGVRNESGENFGVRPVTLTAHCHNLIRWLGARG